MGNSFKVKIETERNDTEQCYNHKLTVNYPHHVVYSPKVVFTDEYLEEQGLTIEDILKI